MLVAKNSPSARPPWENPWARFALVRLASLTAVLTTLLVTTFMILHLIPGDPARRIAGPQALPQQVEQLRETLGLNNPLLVQFTEYAKGVLQWDLGTSFVTREPVIKIISDRLPKTAQLAAAAVALMVVLAVPVGIVVGAMTREGRHPRFESLFTGITGVVGALPEYLAATFLVFIFAVWLHWLPVGGAGTWTSLILPALAVAVRPIAALSRIVRVETLNVLAQDYIRTARSKRLPDRLLYFRHALRNVLTAVLTIAGMYFAELIGGTVIVENVFAWPGLGTAIIQAVHGLDLPVIQGTTLFLGLVVVVVNATVDVLLGFVDPRSLVRGW